MSLFLEFYVPYVGKLWFDEDGAIHTSEFHCVSQTNGKYLLHQSWETLPPGYCVF